MYGYIQTYPYIYIYIHIYTYICAYIYISIYITYTHVYICTYTYTLYVCTYRYIYKYIHVNIYIYIYICTWQQDFRALASPGLWLESSLGTYFCSLSQMGSRFRPGRGTQKIMKSLIAVHSTS